MSNIIRQKQKETKKFNIWKLQIKKLSALNKTYKEDNIRLQRENYALSNQFGKLKTLMIETEKQNIFNQIEAQWAMEELVKENDNLKRLLLINHDYTTDIDKKIQELEEQERRAEKKKFRMLKLKEEAEQRLRDSIALAEKKKQEDLD